MTSIDVIILSYAKDAERKRMTERAINSVIASESDIKFNFIIVESHPDIKYPNTTTINVTPPFAYNRFLKIGFKYFTDAPYLLLLNNDIEAKQNFATRLIKGLEIYDSVSPACPRMMEHKYLANEYSEGFSIWEPTRLCGWAIMHKKELFNKISVDDLYDDRFIGWYADNSYGYMLQLFNLKHALVKSAKVDHLGSRTLHGIDNREEITFAQYPVYERWKVEIDEKYRYLHYIE